MRIQSEGLPAASAGFIRERIDKDYVRKVLEDLIRIPSVTPPDSDGEARAAAYLAGRMAELGMDARCDTVAPGRANAVGRLEGPSGSESPVLILNGHLDVVPAGDGWKTDPFGPVVENGRVYGRGSADMKGAIAAMLGAVKLIRDCGPPIGCAALLAFVCDEEAGNRGVAHFLDECPRADFAIIGEPTRMEICTAHRGVIRFRIATHGRSGHIGKPEGTVNAIYKMKKVIDAVEACHAELKKRTHALLPSPTMGVSIIQGGVKDNIVPAECAIIVDRRLLPGETGETARAEMEAMLDGIASADPEFHWSMEALCYLAPGEADTANGQVKKLQEIHRRYFGGEARLTGFQATCEQVCFLDKGINAVICGPGGIEEAHTANESVDLNEVWDAAGFYAGCIMNGAAFRI